MVINVDIKEQFERMLDRIKNLEKEANRLLQETLRENDALLVQMNKDNLYQGKRSDGTKLEPGYTDFTKQIKRQKGQPTNRVTWRDTGDLYDSLKVKVENEQIIFITDVPYYKGPNGLKQKYKNPSTGADGLGLPVEEVIKVVRPLFTEKIRQYLGISNNTSASIA